MFRIQVQAMNAAGDEGHARGHESSQDKIEVQEETSTIVTKSERELPQNPQRQPCTQIETVVSITHRSCFGVKSCAKRGRRLSAISGRLLNRGEFRRPNTIHRQRAGKTSGLSRQVYNNPINCIGRQAHQGRQVSLPTSRAASKCLDGGYAEGALDADRKS